MPDWKGMCTHFRDSVQVFSNKNKTRNLQRVLLGMGPYSAYFAHLLSMLTTQKMTHFRSILAMQ